MGYFRIPSFLPSDTRSVIAILCLNRIIKSGSRHAFDGYGLEISL